MIRIALGIFIFLGGVAMANEQGRSGNNKGGRLSQVETNDPTQRRGALTPQEMQAMTDPGIMMQKIIEHSIAGNAEKVEELYAEYQRRFMQDGYPQEPLRSPQLRQPSHTGTLR